MCCWEVAGSIPEFLQWRIQRRGPGRDLPLPLSKGLDDRPPPLISRSGSGTVIYHPNSYNTSPMLLLFAVVAGQRQGGINWNTLYFSKYINSHDSFYWQIFHERTSNSWHIHAYQKHIFCDLRLYKRTFYESFKTLPIITTKHEADNRVDSTVSVNQKVGYIKV